MDNDTTTFTPHKIRKTSKQAYAILRRAKTVHTYGLFNNFIGAPIPQDGLLQAREIYLAKELQNRHAYLRQNTPTTFTLHVHANLWYEIDTGEPDAQRTQIPSWIRSGRHG